MEKIWLGTNWKMHKMFEEGITYSKRLAEITRDANQNIEFFIIPTYTSLRAIKDILKGTRIKVGAQNCHWESQGAYTGEISPEMLAEIGLEIVELGHSERRQYYNENDADINKKVHAVNKCGMRPLICVGENITQKSYGIAREVIASQLKICLFDVSAQDALNTLVAYEPVWAIGEKGVPADPEHVAIIHNTIRNVLNDKYGAIGEEIPILYGGSVNEINSMEYLKLPNVNGLFIGRAAWDLTSFSKIISDVDSYLTPSTCC